ncbi:Ribose import ATP-binding protein RbsA [Paracoccus haematequi]|uniref:Ribose import ATP-binding protein RbsA n=1 Tax=Paracoccus haematequi TaxID=2491866 RepID=A0A447IK38_9RHOB|nr:YbhB/YbcL family Raf kinase inhibitor-like protein [Paracoccus haematequi]VDS07868.1 Ribose import ATP-binding protein RbsA [Paracoccus haematequi]
MQSVAIDISDVRKTFGPTVALARCTLRAWAGEVHAIIGGNGSGKSTLAKVISGVLVPDQGQVSILGKSATSPYEARALGIANVFQEVLVADECSVYDNLFLGADGLLGSNGIREERFARASKLMSELLGFDLDLNVKVGELPLSVKQWITIARGMLTNPKVLILDESSAALDYESTERLFRKMREMKAQGCAIMIVTHRIAELTRIADRATVLRDGVTVGTLEKSEITEANILSLIAGAAREREQKALEHATRSSDRPLLRLTDGQVWADGEAFDFTLFPGEVVGVTGLDGQGQADFVRALAGVQGLVSGQIAVVRDGVSERVFDLQSARENKISYVSGDRKKEGIFPNLGIFENMVLPIYRDFRAGGWLNFINRTKLGPIFDWEAKKLAVKMGDPGNLITSLSGGNQQKVLIARAFAEKPAVLVLNDPARGIDIGAKYDLYRNLRDFAARGHGVVFLSSEIEEFVGLCSRVVVFRGGTVSASFDPPFEPHVILNATFGRRATAAVPGEEATGGTTGDAGSAAAWRDARDRAGEGRPAARPAPLTVTRIREADLNQSRFILIAPAIAQGAVVPGRFTEESRISPALEWEGVPEGTQSFALSVTDPDLPAEFNFPRSFAHWMVHGIPAHIRSLSEGASATGAPQTGAMPAGAIELNSDYVTFGIPGFGRGYGGPWPPDRSHRYVFTLYALKAARLDLPQDADLTAFAAAVLPLTIDQASFTAVYGPARKPLPSA